MLAERGDVPRGAEEGCVVGAELGPVRLGFPRGLASTPDMLGRCFLSGLSE